MRKIIILILLALLFVPNVAEANIYGVIRGKVVDSEGQGLIGATVMVLGTQRGASVREPDGSFTIVNVVAGSYEVRFRYIGKQETIQKVNVSAAHTSDLGTIVMRDEGGVTTEIVYVDVQREMVRKDAIGSRRVVTSEEITSGTRNTISGVIGQSAGVSTGGGGFNIRGSRQTETQVRVDGFDVGNQFTGGFGLTGTNYFPMVSAFATSEVNVMTGAFSAEYGDAMGGVVNSIVNVGRTDRYDGFMRWRTDVGALWGSQADGLQVVKDGTTIKPVDAGKGFKLEGPDMHEIEAGFSGPIPLLNNTTFSLSTVYKYERNRGNYYAINDPLGNNLGDLPDNGAWVRNITGRIAFPVAEGVRLVLGGTFGLSSLESSGWGWLYADRPGLFLDQNGEYTVSNNIPERIAKQAVADQLIGQGFVKINHTLSNSSFYDLDIAWNTNNDKFSRRVGWEDPSYFGGFDVIEPQDDYTVSQGELVPGKNKVLDHYEYITRPKMLSQDKYYEGTLAVRNPLTGYYEGNVDRSGTNNAYGLQDYFNYGGNTSAVQFRVGSYWEVRGAYTNLFKTGDFEHMLKAGAEVRLYELHRSYNGSPYTGNPFYDVYTDLWGGNLYSENEEVLAKTNKPYTPFRLSGFLQDQISYKGIVFSPGVRFDFFNPNSFYRTYTDRFVQIQADSGFAETSTKFQLSPRINIAYPITDRSLLSINYGLYFQMPQMQNLYDAFATEILRGGSILGNPEMDAQRTYSYQVNYEHQLADNFLLTLSAYYKDIYNQLGISFIPAVPDAYHQYTISEYGNAKGIELTFRMREMNNVSFDANYSLATVTGTSTSPADNYSRSIDIYTDKFAFPLAEFYQPWDIRHNINANFIINFRRGQGPSIGGIKLLQNTRIALTGTFRTGTPYTRSDSQGRPLSDEYGERNPSVWSADLRLARTIYLSDIFGDTFGRGNFEFFVDVYNLTNRTQPTSYWPYSGNPNDDGVSLTRTPGFFSPTVFYEKADYANPMTFLPSQYDNYGYRLYNPIGDLDGNGAVTQAEKYENYIKYIENALQRRQRYQTPRRVYAGIMFRF